jgi:hypothetical protein
MYRNCKSSIFPPYAEFRAHNQMNRADPTLLEYMKYHIDNVDPSQGPTYEKAKKFGQILIDNCKLLSGAS